MNFENGLDSSSKKTGIHKLGSNILIFTIGSFASKLMNYFLLPLYTAVLSQRQYGIYDIVVTTINLIYPIFTLLITESTLRFALDSSSSKSKVFTLSSAVTALSILIALAFSPLILLSSVYKDYWLFFVLYYIATAIHTLISQFTKGIEKTKTYAIGGIISTAVALALNILLLVVFKTALTGYFIASVSGLTVSSVYMFCKCRMWRYFCRITAEDKSLLRDMLRYSIPIMPNSISWWLSTSSGKYIINYHLGVAESGLFSVAYKIPSLMTVFTSIVLSAWTISAVEDFGSEKSKCLYSEVYNYFFTLIVVLSSVVIAGTKLISSILFSADFYFAWRFVPMLVTAYIFHDLSAFLGSVYTSSKKTQMLFTSTLVGAVINVLVNIVTIPKFGTIGAAFATLISYFIIWLIRFFNTGKIIRINYRYIHDCLCLLLIFAEMIIVTADIKYSLYISLVIVSVILVLQSKIIIEFSKMMLSKLKNRHSS